MVCENMTDALVEDVIEIAWIFDTFEKSGKIKDRDEVIEECGGSDYLKQEIRQIAEDFEKDFPFETAWSDGSRDYFLEILKFARSRLLNKFGRKKTYYVSYSGSTIVEAMNEDEACELAADKISLAEINAYEMDENGEIKGLK